MDTRKSLCRRFPRRSRPTGKSAKEIPLSSTLLDPPHPGALLVSTPLSPLREKKKVREGKAREKKARLIAMDRRPAPRESRLFGDTSLFVAWSHRISAQPSRAKLVIYRSRCFTAGPGNFRCATLMIRTYTLAATRNDTFHKCFASFEWVATAFFTTSRCLLRLSQVALSRRKRRGFIVKCNGVGDPRRTANAHGLHNFRFNQSRPLLRVYCWK